MPEAEFPQLLWLEIALFRKKALHNIEKHSQHSQNIWYFVKIKGFESLGYGVIISEKKKKFFDLGVAHGDPIFAQVGRKNNNY